MEFSGKVAMITGASVGIGRACAIQLAREGAALVLLDLNESGLDRLKEELAAYTREVRVFCCNIADEERVADICAQVIREWGKVDILINNAAIWRSQLPFSQIPVKEWKTYLDVNVMGAVYCMRGVLDSMLQHGYGRIINVASVAGVYGIATMTHYSATKGALIALTKALAKEVADKGICVNAVSPGSVSPSDEPDIDYTQPSTLSFMGRTGSDRENADLICFLAGDKASYISGQNIQIDGCRKKQ